MPRVGLHFALVLVLAPFSVLSAADTPEEEVRFAIERFMQATKGEDLDGIMKLVDVPWYHQGDRIIQEREQLKNEFKGLFEKADFGDLSFSLKKIVTYSEVRDQTNAEERKLLDEVLTKTDRVVLLQVERAKSKQKDSVVVLVRLRDGKVNIVGVKD
jgi:hypothetical protein